jgi:hypothetical protein
MAALKVRFWPIPYPRMRPLVRRCWFASGPSRETRAIGARFFRASFSSPARIVQLFEFDCFVRSSGNEEIAGLQDRTT